MTTETKVAQWRIIDDPHSDFIFIEQDGYELVRLSRDIFDALGVATLIAAAPALLAACHEALAVVRTAERLGLCGQPTVDRLEAVIAKAT